MSTTEVVLRELSAVRVAVERTSTLRSILDSSWFGKLEAEITLGPVDAVLQSDKAGIFNTFRHPLRGVKWFEEGQQQFLSGRLSDLSSGQALAIASFGVDPLIAFLPKLDARLASLSNISFKQDVVRAKFNLLRATREDLSFRNHLFEVSVLADLALKSVLTDIEDPSTVVDAVIEIEGRPILIEATNTTQEFLPGFTGAFFVNVDREVNQVVDKLHKKVAEGRQIARAGSRPAVLFLALNRRGADSQSAEDAIRQCFSDSDFASLSGIVVADSWRFLNTRWYTGVRPDAPLTPAESEQLESWYGTK